VKFAIKDIVISNKNETTLERCPLSPNPFLPSFGFAQEPGRKGSKVLPSPYLGEGAGVRKIFVSFLIEITISDRK
jgi:hypothetical protein